MARRRRAADGASYYDDIPLVDLNISNSNVRRRDIIADVDALASSIERHGLQQPIVVLKAGDKYEVLIGQRRFLAFRELGRETIPARVITEPLGEIEAKVLSFSENVQRRDLAPRDKGEVCRYLYEELGSARAVAEEIGVSQPTVYKWLGYDAVPESLKRSVQHQMISPSQAVRLWTSLEDEEKAVKIAELIGEKQPPPLERERILTAAEELPERSVPAIMRRAEALQKQTEITFVLPQRSSRAITAASEKLNKDINDIARDATIEWVEQFESSTGV